MNYFKQDKPFVVPTTDARPDDQVGRGKLIEEHFGLISTKTSNLSIAHHMVALRAGMSHIKILSLMNIHW